MKRFWSKVDGGAGCWEWNVDGGAGCWEWKARRRPTGYGQFRFHGRIQHAHRVAWELTHGAIPPGMRVLHRCDNPPCVNPSHLFLGTDADNVRDRDTKGRRTAPHGEGHGGAKLTEVEVRAIRAQASLLSHSALAEQYSVSKSTITDLISRKTWKHV